MFLGSTETDQRYELKQIFKKYTLMKVKIEFLTNIHKTNL